MLAQRVNRTQVPVATMWLCLLSLASAAGAECPPFHDSLNDQAKMVANGGAISGPVAFGSAVKGNGAYFSGNAYIRYTNQLFTSQEGSVSLWFRKTSSDVFGGIMQIGQLGQPNSVALFYNDQGHLYFEVRDSTGAYLAIDLAGALTQNDYTHIVATWKQDGGLVMKLFVNGRYIAYRFESNSVVRGRAQIM